VAEPPLARQPGNGRAIAWIVYVVLLITIAYAASAAAGKDPVDLLFRYLTAVVSTLGYALLALPVLLILRDQSKRHLLGLHPPVSWPLAIKLAGAVVLADFVFTYLYSWVFVSSSDAAIPSFWDGSRADAFVLNLVAIAVVAPIAEELMFRGVGYGLLERFGTWTAITVTGVLFGLMHGYLIELPVFIAYGLTLGWLRSRTRSVYPVMLAHGVTNAVAIILAVASAGGTPVCQNPQGLIWQEETSSWVLPATDSRLGCGPGGTGR